MGRRTSVEENTMAKYLLLKHYRGAPASVNDVHGGVGAGGDLGARPSRPRAMSPSAGIGGGLAVNIIEC